jgi:hypothetical protein
MAQEQNKEKFWDYRRFFITTRIERKKKEIEERKVDIELAKLDKELEAIKNNNLK